MSIKNKNDYKNNSELISNAFICLNVFNLYTYRLFKRIIIQQIMFLLKVISKYLLSVIITFQNFNFYLPLKPIEILM